MEASGLEGNDSGWRCGGPRTPQPYAPGARDAQRNLAEPSSTGWGQRGPRPRLPQRLATLRPLPRLA